MPLLNFDLPDEPEEGDPPVIRLDGEDFPCLSQMPTAAWRALGGWDWSVESAHSFIEGCLVDDATVEAWRKRCAARKRIVTNKVVADVVNSLIAAYGRRPTPSSSDSAPGLPQTAPGSEGDSSASTSTSPS